MPGAMNAPNDIASGRKLTPMLRQFIDAKAQCPEGAILLFRMGDFYETFFDDAEIAARELDITLTSRDKSSAEPIPMAGVPWHSVSGYITRLIERGYTVAICDQVEDPKAVKGIVRREITQLITPGTLSDLDALDPQSTSYLAWLEPGPEDDTDWTIALLDLLAGEVLCTRSPSGVVLDELRRAGAREVVVPRDAMEALPFDAKQIELPVRRGPERSLDAPLSEVLMARLGSSSIEGVSSDEAVTYHHALYRLIEYAEGTQRRQLRHLMAARSYRINDTLVLDEATRRNLELTSTLRDSKRRGSLLWHLDRCRTSMGSRRMHQWLLFPLRERAAIESRLDAVESIKNKRSHRHAVRGALDGIRDIERLVGRLAVGRAHPGDLGALRDSLVRIPGLVEGVAAFGGTLGARWHELDAVDDIRTELETALVAEPPTATTDGEIFNTGYREDLDALIALSTEGHDFLRALELRERERTGIPTLKVRYNKVFGYYLEVSRAHLERVPEDYVRKQTLVNAERFISDELKDYETRVLGADESRKRREQELFEELVQALGGKLSRLRSLARAVAEIDALASLAEVADEGRYVRPELCDGPQLDVEGGRHPVLERMLPTGERFVPNDTRIDADRERLMIITGPNMAGKSTVMRQVALSAILAHVGSFVPASRARIGICDRIFTRVGASDDIGRGQSTFMVEMVEAATILKHATRHSLVILDEIGRGTSTFDGVSIAWSVAEYLHDQTQCRAMFATHYHELTDLELERPGIVNASVAVAEREGRIVFLRTLKPGAANRSYGIQVGELAGLPAVVVERAKEILANLESGEYDDRGLPALAFSRKEAAAKTQGQLALFAPARAPSEIENELAALTPDELSPRAALELVYSLHDKAKRSLEPSSKP
ncbi:MAG: DNA mismatch repair protein MutS [Myxococcota bacterium]